MAAHQLEVALYGVLARRVVGAEPGGVSGRATRDTLKVRVGIVGVGLSTGGGGIELRLHGRRATGEGCSLAMDTGDSEVTKEFNLGGILNGGEQGLGNAVGIDVGEKIRWLDGIFSSPGSGEVVRTGD